MGSATCATADATSMQVDATPTTGANGRIALTTLGRNRFMVIPMTMGANTTCIVENAIPAASTGTTAPKIDLHNNGVMTMAPKVVAVVIKTLNATLPRAMYVHKLEA